MEASCPSCHPINNVKAPKGKSRINSYSEINQLDVCVRRRASPRCGCGCLGRPSCARNCASDCAGSGCASDCATSCACTGGRRRRGPRSRRCHAGTSHRSAGLLLRPRGMEAGPDPGRRRTRRGSRSDPAATAGPSDLGGSSCCLQRTTKLLHKHLQASHAKVFLRLQNFRTIYNRWLQ